MYIQLFSRVSFDRVSASAEFTWVCTFTTKQRCCLVWSGLKGRGEPVQSQADDLRSSVPDTQLLNSCFDCSASKTWCFNTGLPEISGTR